MFFFLIYRYQSADSINNSIYIEYNNYLMSDFFDLTKIKDNILAVNDNDGSYSFEYSIIFDRGTIYIIIFHPFS